MSQPDAPMGFMEPGTLRELIRSRKPVVIIDVRSPQEFATDHVDGAINIPADRLAERTDLPKGASIVTVCNHGGQRSRGAAQTLRAMGYADAVPLRGGTRGWLDGKE